MQRFILLLIFIGASQITTSSMAEQWLPSCWEDKYFEGSSNACWDRTNERDGYILLHHWSDMNLADDDERLPLKEKQRGKICAGLQEFISPQAFYCVPVRTYPCYGQCSIYISQGTVVPKIDFTVIEERDEFKAKTKCFGLAQAAGLAGENVFFSLVSEHAWPFKNEYTCLFKYPVVSDQRAN